MNKVLMAAVAFAMGSTSAMAANVFSNDTTSVDVYGYAKGAHKFTAHGVKNGTDASELRLGVKGKQQLNQQFALTGQVEGNYDIKGEKYTTRQAWGGIDAGSYGAVSVGRQTGALYDVIGLSDMAPGVLSGYSAANGTLSSRSDSIIQYKNTIGNVDVKAQYKLETSGKGSEYEGGTGAAYGGSVVVHNLADTGIFAGAAYANQHASKGVYGDSSYSIGTGWTDGSYYTAATYTAGTKSSGKHFHDTEVIAQKTFDNGLTPSVGYVETDFDGPVTRAAETGVSYAFNKNVSTFVDAGWDLTGKGDHQVKTGIKYAF